MSRWKMPWEWAYSRAAATCRPTRATLRQYRAPEPQSDASPDESARLERQVGGFDDGSMAMRPRFPDPSGREAAVADGSSAIEASKRTVR